MSDPEPTQNPTPPVTEAQPIVTHAPEPISLPPEPAVSEPANLEMPLDVPPGAPGAPTANDAPAPSPVQDSPNPTPTPVPPPIVTPILSPKSFLTKALETIQFRKKAKLEKIIKLATEKRSITNDQVEKLLRVSDATATRYLSQLVKDGKLKRVGKEKKPRYEPVTGSIGGN